MASNNSALSDIEKLKAALDPNSRGLHKHGSTKGGSSDASNANRVREQFLGYRKQIMASLEMLAKNSDANDAKVMDIQKELVSLTMVLDKLDKRKNVSADTLLSFVGSLSRVGKGLNDIGADSTNQSLLAKKLRENQKIILDDDIKQDKRVKELEEGIGERLNTFTRRTADMISSGSGSVLKGALSSMLGPGAPLFSALNRGANADEKMGRMTSGLLNAARTTAKSIVSMPSKIIKGGEGISETLYERLKERWRQSDMTAVTETARTREIFNKIVANTRDMKAKLKALAEKAGGGTQKMLMKLALGLGAVLSKLKGFFSSPLSLLRSLASVVSPRGVARAGAGALGRGAKKIWNNAGRLSKGLGKGLGIVGGAYGMYDGANRIESHKGQGFFDGGLDSRAGGYAESIAGGAMTGASIGSIIPGIGTAVGAAVGAAVGGLTAAIIDNKEALNRWADEFKKWLPSIAEIKTTVDTTAKNSKDLLEKGVVVAKEVAKEVGSAIAVKADAVGTAIAVKAEDISHKLMSKDLGHLSAKYEGKIGTVQKDNNKSMAYGKFQFNNKAGGLANFFKANPEYESQFNGMDREGPEFGAKWKSLARNDPNFEKAQDKAAKLMYFDPNVKFASKLGFKMENPGVQESLFSGAVQHGGIKEILKAASEVAGFKGMSAEDQVKAFYEARAAYVKDAKVAGGPKVKEGLYLRYSKESKDAVALAKAGPSAARGKVDSSALPDSRAIPPAYRGQEQQQTNKDNGRDSPNQRGAQPFMKQTVDTMNFMPNDMSLILLNVHGLMG